MAMLFCSPDDISVAQPTASDVFSVRKDNKIRNRI